MPELSYGGHPLLFDLNHQIKDFLDQFQSLDDLVVDCENVNLGNGRNGWRRDKFVGLSSPNYPHKPPVKINQLYWPTGAVRWSTFYGLADKTTKDKMVADAAQGALKLKAAIDYNDGRDRTVTYSPSMYLLPPRKISGSDGDDSIWLIPLVDDRYNWQYEHIGDPGDSVFASWTAMLDHLASQLGFSFQYRSTIPSGFVKPDIEELRRRYDDAAMIMDAVAHSIGMRIVVGLDNGVQIINAQDSTDRFTSSIDSQAKKVIAGGEIPNMHVPGSVIVTFPKAAYGRVFCNYDVHAITGSPSTNITTHDGTKVIHTTALADFTNDSLQNGSVLSAIATQATQDFYDWQEILFDVTHTIDAVWNTIGYTDHSLYNFGSESYEDSWHTEKLTEFEFETTRKRQFHASQWQRHVSHAHNFYVSQQLHRDVDRIEPGDLLFRVEISSEQGNALAIGGSCLANRVDWTGSTWAVNSSVQMTIYDSLNRFSGQAGDRFWVTPSCESGLWEVVSPAGSGSLIVGNPFELTSSLVLGGTAPAEDLDCSQLKNGNAVTVKDILFKFSGVAGYRGLYIDRPICQDKVIIEMQRRARFIYASLDSSLNSQTRQATATVSAYWDGVNPGSSVTVEDLAMTATNASELEAGDQFVACWRDNVNEPTGRYVIIEKFQGLRWAKVTSATPGQALGVCIPWTCQAVDNCAGGGADNPAVAITVWTHQDVKLQVDDVIPYRWDEDSKFVSPWDGRNQVEYFKLTQKTASGTTTHPWDTWEANPYDTATSTADATTTVSVRIRWDNTQDPGWGHKSGNVVPADKDEDGTYHCLWDRGAIRWCRTVSDITPAQNKYCQEWNCAEIEDCEDESAAGSFTVLFPKWAKVSKDRNYPYYRSHDGKLVAAWESSGGDNGCDPGELSLETPLDGDRLYGYWPLNEEEGRRQDYGIHKAHLVPRGTDRSEVGSHGLEYHVIGNANDYLAEESVPRDWSAPPSLTPFSLYVRINADHMTSFNPAYGAGIVSYTTGDFAGDWILAVDDDGAIHFLHWRNNGADLDGHHITADGVISEDTDYGIAVTHKDNNYSLYVNGSPVSFATQTTTASSWGNLDLNVGRSFTTSTFAFHGRISSLVITLNRELTEGEIGSIHCGGINLGTSIGKLPNQVNNISLCWFSRNLQLTESDDNCISPRDPEEPLKTVWDAESFYVKKDEPENAMQVQIIGGWWSQINADSGLIRTDVKREPFNLVADPATGLFFEADGAQTIILKGINNQQQQPQQPQQDSGGSSDCCKKLASALGSVIHKFNSLVDRRFVPNWRDFIVGPEIKADVFEVLLDRTVLVSTPIGSNTGGNAGGNSGGNAGVGGGNTGIGGGIPGDTPVGGGGGGTVGGGGSGGTPPSNMPPVQTPGPHGGVEDHASGTFTTSPTRNYNQAAAGVTAAPSILPLSIEASIQDYLCVRPRVDGTTCIGPGQSFGKHLETISFDVSRDETTTITTGTGKLVDRVPYAFAVHRVRASLATVSSSGVVTIDVNKNGASIFSTTLTIDANEKTSTTAAIAHALSSTVVIFDDDDEISIDIDTAGTGATGLKVRLIGYRTEGD